MTPFLSKGGHTYKGRVTDRRGVRHILSLKTREFEDAVEIEESLRWFRKHRKWELIDLILADVVTTRAAHEAYLGGYLEQFTVDAAAAAARAEAAAAQAAADPELAPLVDEWVNAGTAPKYVIQVRRFLTHVGAAARVSTFRRKEISQFLASLTMPKGSGEAQRLVSVSGSTKNRYRVALSQFGRFLVERELIDANPVRDVRGAPENKPRMIYYNRDEAKSLVKALSGPQRALEALMAACGVEWQACERLRGRDVNFEETKVWAQGTKTKRYHAYRTRWAVATEPWAWEIFAAYARDFSANALLFTMAEERALEAHHEAVAALELTPSTLHDWRHTYAIYSLADQIASQAVRRNLGHAPNSTVLERVYAAWIPTRPEDYAKRSQPAAAAAQAAQVAAGSGTAGTRRVATNLATNRPRVTRISRRSDG